ncbi:YerC/YecD family TrpR-related protein [Oscillospiraceae bacterium OttesenSCG-928-F05]|nr:YerC/YecD family TrpR-related protein [Oscillospiraceae bacterium OttesenSCG-928-F05]
MNGKLSDKKMDMLFEAVLSLKSLEDCYCFFEDLCTISELKAMEQRYQVAMMLEEGQHYTEIAAETGASSATISRVGRALNYGADGYKRVLERRGKSDGV